MLMRGLSSAVLGVATGMCALVACQSAQAQAFEVKPAQQANSGFFLDAGGQLRLATRDGRNSAPNFRTLPYAGIGYGDVFALDTQEGGWLQLGRAGSFGFGPAVTFDRHLTTPLKSQSRVTDIFGAARTGAFMRYVDGQDEWGRLTVTSGILGSGSSQGFDIKATKRFGVADGLSLNFGPTLSFGDGERFGAVTPLSVNPNRLAATGAALQIEKELGRNLTATIAANYALVHTPPNSGAPLPGGRNRFDIGLTLSTRLIGQ
jgi:hypothetical protein